MKATLSFLSYEILLHLCPELVISEQRREDNLEDYTDSSCCNISDNKED